MPKLAEWLREKDVSPAQFALRIRVAKSTVYHWLDELKPTFPQREHLDLVYAETKGEVTAHDFITAGPRPETDVPDAGVTRQENNRDAAPKANATAMRDDAEAA